MGCLSLGFPPLSGSFLWDVCYPTHPSPKLILCNLSSQPLLGIARLCLPFCAPICAPASGGAAGSGSGAAVRLGGPGGHAATSESCVAASTCCGCVPVQGGLKCAFMWAGQGLKKRPHLPGMKAKWLWGTLCVCPLLRAEESPPEEGQELLGAQPCLAPSYRGMGVRSSLSQPTLLTWGS